MTRYFLDIHDGSVISLDREGEEFADLEAAKREAVHAVTELSRGHALRGKTEKLGINVRNESGKTVLFVRLTLDFITP